MSTHVERLQNILSGVELQIPQVAESQVSLDAKHAAGFISDKDYKQYTKQRNETMEALLKSRDKLKALIRANSKAAA
jgi:hypothetical protein